MLTLTRRARYRIANIAPGDYRTTTDAGEKPAEVTATFTGIWRDGDVVSALFAQEDGGNVSIPLASLERYDISSIGA